MAVGDWPTIVLCLMTAKFYGTDFPGEVTKV
jgi:hypothetical protein